MLRIIILAIDYLKVPLGILSILGIHYNVSKTNKTIDELLVEIEKKDRQIEHLQIQLHACQLREVRKA